MPKTHTVTSMEAESAFFEDDQETFRTAAEAEQLIRRWLPDDDGRACLAAHLPACVAEASWVDRAAIVLGDLRRMFPAAVEPDARPSQDDRQLRLMEA